MKFLNLGCGELFIEGWTNLDFRENSPFVSAANLLEGIPFPDREFDVIYHSHVLEHFTKQDGEKFIAECFRVLKPDGVIRIVVPDLESMARTYLEELAKARENDPIAIQNCEWMVLEFIDQASRHTPGGAMREYLLREPLENENFVRERTGELIDQVRSAQNAATTTENANKSRSWFGGFTQRLRSLMRSSRLRENRIGAFRLRGEVHLWMYDSVSLSHLLERTGFVNIEVRSADSSSIKNWNSYCELDMTEGRPRKPESIYVEAVRP